MISVSRFCFACLFICAVLALIGCGGDVPSPATAPASAPAREVRVAAASDLKFALDEVIGDFQGKHPTIKVSPTYGSSGNFYSQLSNKAPFDIYFSADAQYPRKLVEAGVALKDSQFDYAVGRIVVWVPKSSTIDVATLGMESLAQPSVRKIAIANPEHAPYGRAAEAAMKKLNVYDRVKDRLVLGENITQTAQFIESGSADIGIIALSLAIAPAMKDKGTYWLVPADAHPAIEQAGVILTWAKDADATQQFKAFVVGPEGRTILKRYGFVLPGE